MVNKMSNANMNNTKRIHEMWHLSDDEVTELPSKDLEFYKNHVVDAQSAISTDSAMRAEKDAAYAAYLNSSRVAPDRAYAKWARRG